MPCIFCIHKSVQVSSVCIEVAHDKICYGGILANNFTVEYSILKNYISEPLNEDDLCASS